MYLVAVVGRPNVGKSTLFNRIIQRREAIVEDTPGVTRDRIYSDAEWNGRRFTIIDTGGIVPRSDDVIEKAIREQAQMAIEEADSIVFVCDAKDGVTATDRDIASILRRTKKRVTLAVNKCDNPSFDLSAHEFYQLGLGEPFSISGLNGRSTGDFLDEVIKD
ncbi:MAG: GTPase, partial [Candidatus Kapaibacterium sp.]